MPSLPSTPTIYPPSPQKKVAPKASLHGPSMPSWTLANFLYIVTIHKEALTRERTKWAATRPLGKVRPQRQKRRESRGSEGQGGRGGQGMRGRTIWKSQDLASDLIALYASDKKNHTPTQV